MTTHDSQILAPGNFDRLCITIMNAENGVHFGLVVIEACAGKVVVLMSVNKGQTETVCLQHRTWYLTSSSITMKFIRHRTFYN